MPPRLPGQPRLSDKLVELARRAPGSTEAQLSKWVGLDQSATKDALRRLVKQGRLEHRRVREDDHLNYGRMGYFGMGRNPL